jgi:hypothetical protein
MVGYGMDWKKETAVRTSVNRCTMNAILFEGAIYG